MGRMDISAVAGMWLDRPPEEALHTAVLADRLGFDELWIGETGTWDAFSLATAIGLATDRIALTVGPLPVIVRDPVTIAMGAASVAALTRRRVGVALGTPSTTAAEEWHGRPHSHAAAALEESARAVALLLAGDRVNPAAPRESAAADEAQGAVGKGRPGKGGAGRRHARAGDAPAGYRLRLAPPGGPLAVAALGDRAVEVAAEYADRMVINLVTPEIAGGLKQRLGTAAAKAGRAAPKLVAWMPAAVDPVPESYAQLIWGIVPYLSAPGYAENLAAAGFGRAVELARGGTAPRDLLPALPLEMAGTIGLAGDVTAVRARLAAYEDAGVDEVAVMPVTGGDPGGERTLTAIRELADGR
jgi:alkanesulfonate monooxygenase SsuD/methylene tetrahydromethanopterin reductase-like flavin-dependent oxidoreductase (luciferase family)